MNPAHLHLLINHFPIIGSLIGGFVLGYGIWSKSIQTKIAAYYVLLASTAGAVIAYLTGEGAEEIIENIQGISKEMLDQHEDFSLISLVVIIILGIFSIIGLFLTIRKSTLSNTVAVITLLTSLVSFGLIARTGYLGGQIRHTEINSAGTNNEQNNGEKSETD